MKEYQIQEAFCSKLRLLIISHLITKKLLFKEKTGKISKVTEPKRKLGDEKCETGFAD